MMYNKKKLTTSCLSSIKLKLAGHIANSYQTVTVMNFNQVVILVLLAAAAYAQWPFEPNEEDEFMQDYRPSFETDKADRNRNPSHDTIGSSDRNRFQQYPETKDKETNLPLDNKATEQELTRVRGTFFRPFYIHIADKKVFVTEYGYRNAPGNITVLNLEGEVLRNLSIPYGNPTGLFVKGNRVLVTNHRNEIFSLSTDGELLGIQYSKKPLGVAVDEFDTIYASEWAYFGRIHVFHHDGTKSHTISLGDGLNYLHKIQFDKQGSLYVSDVFTNDIKVFTKCGKLNKTIQIPEEVFRIEGIHLNGDNLYVTDRGRLKGHGKVVVMSISSGTLIKTITGLVHACDVAVAPDGKLWIVDCGDFTIKRYG